MSETFQSKNILISCLDWGMGHGSRSVPIIEALLSSGHTVFIAGNVQQIEFFTGYFGSSVNYLSCPSYNMKYSRFIPLAFKILSQFPKIIFTSLKENKWLGQVIVKKNIQVVISDNRFGMYNKAIKNIYITHQLNVKSPLGLNLAARWHKKIMNSFSEIWIPDEPDGISGELSFPVPTLKPVVKFIGPLSALQKSGLKKKGNSILILLSGPEPERELLEQKLLLITSEFENQEEVILVRGSSRKTEKNKYTNKIKIIDFAQGKELSALIESAEVILCRSGYSTLMDLCLFESSAVLIPTPGQSEQEFLAERMNKKFTIPFLKQDNVNKESLTNAIESAKKSKFPSVEKTNAIKSEVIRF